MQTRLPKFQRVPEAVAGKRLTERSLQIILIILRYRFIATHTLVKVAGGNEDVTYRHLQQLYHHGTVSRFALPRHGNRGEFIYFLENAAALRGIAPRLEGEKIDWQQIKSNRDKYSEEKLSDGKDGYGQFLFIKHELMISEFHAGLEVSCRRSLGKVELTRWVQGPALWGQVRLGAKTRPHRPDALFTLFFPSAPEGQQRSNFFYEADRGTTNLTRFKHKLEAHFEYLKQGRQAALALKRIRAVLVETISEQRRKQCMEVAAEIAAKEPLAGMLFWFAQVDNGSISHWSCVRDGRLRTLFD